MLVLEELGIQELIVLPVEYVKISAVLGYALSDFAIINIRHADSSVKPAYPINVQIDLNFYQETMGLLQHLKFVKSVP